MSLKNPPKTSKSLAVSLIDTHAKSLIAIGIVGILLIGLCLRLPLMNESLWFDEISGSRVYLKDFEHLLARVLFRSHMLTHYTFMYFWIKVFGDSQWVLRAQPLLFGLLTIGLTYFVAAKISDRPFMPVKPIAFPDQVSPDPL